MKFATKAVHAGKFQHPSYGSVMPPIYMTTTFLQDFPGEEKEFAYTRANNPNFVILENLLASLEDAAHATVFSSGLGALTAMVSMLSQGDRVVGINGLYGGTYRLFHSIFSRFGIEFITIPSASSTDVKKGLALNPKWLFFETPTNPLLEVYDIAALAKEAKARGILTIVDSTFATPYLQNPLALGADIVWHSTTKYIGGHSDVVGGVAMTNDPNVKQQLDFARKALGVNPSPFDAWLLTRGIKTLALRMQQHEINARKIASYLQNHQLVKCVHYPGLSTHPSHEIAKKNMRGFGGMISAEFNLSLEKTKQMITSYQLFALAESLGGVESLVSHPASMTHAAIPAIERKKYGITDSLIRFSIGIEDTQDLIEDLEQALVKMEQTSHV